MAKFTVRFFGEVHKITLSFPNWSGGGTLNNMDDAQIITLANPYNADRASHLLLVVRAWSTSTGDFTGNQVMSDRFDGCIFLKSGIYSRVSTDAGATWGSWSKVVENTWTTNNPATIEYPRIAYRAEYDNEIGYITWTRKVYDRIDDGDEDIFHVDNTKIGIRAFEEDGGLLTSTVDATPYIDFDDGTDFTESLSFPERASVAISPDKKIWLSFYSVNYNETSGSNTVQDGEIFPEMKVFFTAGTGEINGSNYEFTFDDPPTKLKTRWPSNALDIRHPMGCYRPRFGAIHFAAPIGSVYNSVAQTNLEIGLQIDLASGPSIQVITPNDHNFALNNLSSTSILNFSSCGREYEVGVLYCYGMDDNQNSGSSFGVDFTFKAALSFTALHAKHMQKASDFDQGFPSSLGNTIDYFIHNPTIFTAGSSEELDLRGLGPTQKRPDCFFWPVLKYTQGVGPEACSFERTNEANAIGIYSLFTVAFMACDIKIEEMEGIDDFLSGNCFYHFQLHTGVSFDSRTFRVKMFSTADEERYILGTEPRQTSYSHTYKEPWKEFWGSKVDVCGEYFGRSDAWFVHPVWHRLVPIADITGSKLMTNRTGVIFIKPYIQNTPIQMSDAEIAALTDGVISSNGGTAFRWQNYAYLDFDDGNRPDNDDLVARSTHSFGRFGTLQNKIGTTNGKHFIPGIDLTPTSPAPYQYYYAIFNQASSSQGFLNFSDQRRIVTTGEYAHAAVEKDNKVLYLAARGNDFPGCINGIGIPGEFSPSYQLSANTTAVQKRPSIAVYQEGDPNFIHTGISSIGVTWVEFVSTGETQNEANVYLMIREFDMCSGKWNTWSPQYLIHSHTFSTDPAVHGAFPGGDDGTIPVIAPHSKFVTGPPANKVNLLGWTVTWTCPRLTGNVVRLEHTVGSVYSRTLLRSTEASPHSVITDNTSWGKYVPTSALGLGFLPPFYGAIQPTPTATPTYNTIFESAMPPPESTLGKFIITYPTVVSIENKTKTDKLTQEIAYSADGILPPMWGVWTKTADYTTAGMTIGSLSSLKANDKASAPTDIGFQLTAFDPLPQKLTSAYLRERNPCITVNSSGQVHVAYEQAIAWWFTPLPWGVQGTPQWSAKSNILLTATHMNRITRTGQWQPAGKLRNFTTIVSAGLPDFTFPDFYLRNPSISGFPKSHLEERIPATQDEDPGTVQLYYWQEKEFLGGATNTVNRLKEDFIFSEKPGDDPVLNGDKFEGIWHKHNIIGNIAGIQGQFTHRSFAAYNAGPTFTDPINGNEVGDVNRSYAIANQAANQNLFTIHKNLAYKGTYDTLQGYASYRSCALSKDSSMYKFTWGDVYVGDSSSGLPKRQVILDFVQDTNGFTTLESYHESLFRTEVFDWFPGTEFSYFRGTFMGDSLTASTGGAFNDSSITLHYTIELVHSGGAIDTIEMFEYAPAYGKFINGGTMQVTSGNISARDVYLRVRIVQSGFTADSSNCEMQMEYTDTAHRSFSDSSRVIYKRGNPIPSSLGAGILISSLFPNPIEKGQQAKILATLPHDVSVKIELLDIMGRGCSEPVIVIGTGEVKAVSLPRISASGTYFLRLTCGSNVEVQRIVVE